MNRLGIGCAENRDGNWICVVDAVHGRTAGSADRAVAVVLWPAPDQQDVPCQGFDRIDEAPDHEVGFPVSVTFPGQTQLRKVRAALTDAAGHPVDVRISSPEQPLNAKLQGASIGLHPLHELRSGRTYTVSLSASVDGTPWKHRWTFTTTK